MVTPVRITYSFLVFTVILFAGCNQSTENIFNDDFELLVKYQEKGDSMVYLKTAKEIQLKENISITSGNGHHDNPYKCLLKIENISDQPWAGTVLVELAGKFDDARFFLPGYLYGTNQGEAAYNPKLIKQFPRLRRGKVNFPYSPYWFTRSDQLSHPVAMMFTNGMIAGIAGSPYLTSQQPMHCWSPDSTGAPFDTYNGFMASLQNDVSVGYTVGYMNAPGIYTRPQEIQKYNSNEQGTILIPPGQVAEIPFSVYLYRAENESSVSEIVRHVYHEFHEFPAEMASADTTISKISRAISEDAYSLEHKTYGLISKPPTAGNIDLIDGGHVVYSTKPVDFDQYIYNFEGLIAWTNGTVIAVPLLQASYYLDNEKLRDQAVNVIEHIVNNSINPATGIPFCTMIDKQWTNRGWWTEWIESEGREAGHSSYIVGQALYYILKAYELEIFNKSVTHDNWLEFVTDVFHVIKDSQNKEGAFPRFWDEQNGVATEYDAFSGCWIAAAMAYHSSLTKENTFLRSARKAEEHYFKDVQRMECIKTPLDVADAPDSEGVLSYIRLAKILFEITEENHYLKKLKAGLDYELTFKFCYNVPVTGRPLSNTNWNASGGSITSVCNAVVHCMSNSILDELLFYSMQSNDAYYKSRLIDTYLWGLQAYNRDEHEYFFGKEGWSTEYFCQADRYVLDIRLEDQSRSTIWFAYHPWATASILEGMCGEMIQNEEIITNSELVYTTN